MIRRSFLCEDELAASVEVWMRDAKPKLAALGAALDLFNFAAAKWDDALQRKEAKPRHNGGDSSRGISAANSSCLWLRIKMDWNRSISSIVEQEAILGDKQAVLPLFTVGPAAKVERHHWFAWVADRSVPISYFDMGNFDI